MSDVYAFLISIQLSGILFFVGLIWFHLVNGDRDR